MIIKHSSKKVRMVWTQIGMMKINKNASRWMQAITLCYVNLINYMDRYTVSGRNKIILKSNIILLNLLPSIKEPTIIFLFTLDLQALLLLKKVFLKMSRKNSIWMKSGWEASFKQHL